MFVNTRNRRGLCLQFVVVCLFVLISISSASGSSTSTLEIRFLSKAEFVNGKRGEIPVSLPPEVCPLDRASRLPNVSPYRHIQSNCDIYKFSFHPRSIVMWNQLPIRNLPLPTFKSTIMPTIKSMV